MKKRDKGLNKKGLPIREGVYRIKNPLNPSEEDCDIDVYEHHGQLCCFSEDYGVDEPQGVDDEHNGHVRVEDTGLVFEARVGELDKFIIKCH